MAKIISIHEVRKCMQDEHHLQNVLHQHESSLEQCVKHESKIAELERRLADKSNITDEQKRQISSLKEECSSLHKQLEEATNMHQEQLTALQAQIVQMEAHPDVKAAKLVVEGQRIELLRKKLEEAETAYKIMG